MARGWSSRPSGPSNGFRPYNSMVAFECGRVGVGCSNQGSSLAIHISWKCFQCGGWGLGSNLKEHRSRQLALTTKLDRGVRIGRGRA